MESIKRFFQGSQQSFALLAHQVCNEVDFVLYGRDAFCAIEVKNSGRLKESMVNGLLAFKADYPEEETHLAYRGRERIKIKGVLCVPCAEFLVNMVWGKPFWL
jgi:hypothetical protein